jgi:hypothetical protein
MQTGNSGTGVVTDLKLTETSVRPSLDVDTGGVQRPA